VLATQLASVGVDGGERVIYREFFRVAHRPRQSRRDHVGTRPSLSHVTARAEVMP